MNRTLTKICAVILSVLMLTSLTALPSASVSAQEEVFIIPDSADNSTSPYFPKIGNQGAMGSCTSWAHVYYSFTYAINKSRGIKTTPENTFSPQWSYNLTSNGEGEGSTAADIEWFLEKQGGVPLSMVPYKEDPVNWCSDLNVWRESINNRLADTIKYKSIGDRSTQITSPDDDDLTEIKTALAKGELLTFSTEIYSWVSTKLKTHKDAPENSKFEGEEAIKYVDGSEGSHAMTLVGYNDNIWVDVNDNNKVDSGEMGAFKIVNSWGEHYANDGFIWMAYDAVNRVSSINGFDGPEKRNQGIKGVEGVVTRPYGDKTDIYIRYNFKTDNRRENYITIIAEKDGTEYTYKAFFPLLTITTGDAKIPYDGNMLIALDNVIPDISAENFYDYNWSVTFTDKTVNECQTTYRNAEIVIESKNLVIKPANAYPITLNGETKTLQFAETNTNHAIIYYRGYSNPTLSYNTTGQWIENCPMESNTEREGYVYKFVVDLGNKSSADIYFGDSKGNKDNNQGKNYQIKKGINYFVTEGVAELIEVTLIPDAEKMERALTHYYATDAKGGYAPYTYSYTFENLDTGAVETTGGRQQDQTIPKIINTTGNYRLTVVVTDYEGTTANASIDFEVIDSPFEFSEFSVENDGELFLYKPIDFHAVTKLESIIRFGASREQYDLVIRKDNKVVYEALLDPVKVNHNGMTSTIDFSWTPDEPGRYTATISGTDYAKEYAEKTIEFEVVNKAVIYYKGYLSPSVNYKTESENLIKLPMEPCLEESGFVNKLSIDLGNAEYAELYFTGENNEKDDNDGENYIVKAGKSYFVTQGAVDALSAELEVDSSSVFAGDESVFTAKVTGGYAPYTYLYSIRNKQTNEISYSESSIESAEYTQAFDEEGVYEITVYVTDLSEDSTKATIEINVITPTEAPVTEATDASTIATVATEPTEAYETTSLTEPEEESSATVDETEAVSTTTEEETSESAEAEIPTETSATTEATSATHPTEITEEIMGIIGDVNADSIVNIKDATLIQKDIARIDTGIEINLQIADCFKDGKTSIKDVTLIQKYLAKFEVENVGETLINYTVVTLPIPTVNVTTATSDETETAPSTEIPASSEALTVVTTLPTEATLDSAPQETTAVSETTITPDETEISTESETITIPETTLEHTTAAEIITTEITEATEITTIEATEPSTQATTEAITAAPTEPPTEPVTEPPVPVRTTVTFTNSFNWSGEIRCYYWSDSDTTMVNWPGIAMQNAGTNDFGETLYTFDVPEGVSWIIFTNGTNQTADIPFIGEAKYYPTPSTNDKGHYIVETW